MRVCDRCGADLVNIPETGMNVKVWLTMDILKADGEYNQKVRFGTGDFDAPGIDLCPVCLQKLTNEILAILPGDTNRVGDSKRKTDERVS